MSSTNHAHTNGYTNGDTNGHSPRSTNNHSPHSSNGHPPRSTNHQQHATTNGTFTPNGTQPNGREGSPDSQGSTRSLRNGFGLLDRNRWHHSPPQSISPPPLHEGETPRHRWNPVAVVGDLVAGRPRRNALDVGSFNTEGVGGRLNGHANDHADNHLNGSQAGGPTTNGDTAHRANDTESSEPVENEAVADNESFIRRAPLTDALTSVSHGRRRGGQRSEGERRGGGRARHPWEW